MPLEKMPERIGNYKVTKELGTGSVGAVYLVEQESLKRKLAIKVLFTECTRDAEFVERFRREGQIAARLRHPNIVQVHDFNDQDGLFYIVMEYVGARNLKDVIHNAGGKLPVDVALRYTDQLLQALSHAHRLGIVHRDIKPANVLISDDDEAVLTDFSIAQMASSNRLTQTGVMMGTPEYMSPEQFDAKNIDGRSDLYATGLMLYEMLLGDHPFAVGSVPLVLKAQLFKVPTAPHVVDPTIPESVGQVIMKSLEKAAADRYASASDMRQALLLASQGAPLPAALAPAKPVQAPLLNLPPTVAVTSESSPPKLALIDKDDLPLEPKAMPPPIVDVFEATIPQAAELERETLVESGGRQEAPRPTVPPTKNLPKILVGLLLVAGVGGAALHGLRGTALPTPSSTPLARVETPPPLPTATAPPFTPAPVESTPGYSATPVDATPSSSATPAVPELAQATIRVSPSSAAGQRITLDGVKIVNAGESVQLTPGHHEFKISAKLFLTQTKKVDFTPGENATLSFDLKPLPSIAVDSDPSAAEILIDGKRIEQKTPCLLKGFQPGDHRVTVRMTGYREASEKIRLKETDKKVKLKLEALPAPPPVNHSTRPPDPRPIYRDPPRLPPVNNHGSSYEK